MDRDKAIEAACRAMAGQFWGEDALRDDPIARQCYEHRKETWARELRFAIAAFLDAWEPSPAVMAATFAAGSPPNIVVAAARAEAARLRSGPRE